MHTYLVNPSSKGNCGPHGNRVAAPVTSHHTTVISSQRDTAVIPTQAALREVSRQGQLPVHHLANEQTEHSKNPHRDVPGSAQEGVDDGSEERRVQAVYGILVGQ